MKIWIGGRRPLVSVKTSEGFQASDVSSSPLLSTPQPLVYITPSSLIIVIKYKLRSLHAIGIMTPFSNNTGFTSFKHVRVFLTLIGVFFASSIDLGICILVVANYCILENILHLKGIRRLSPLSHRCKGQPCQPLISLIGAHDHPPGPH